MSSTYRAVDGAEPMDALHEAHSAETSPTDDIVRRAVDAAADGFVIYSPEGIVVYANLIAMGRYGVLLGERMRWDRPTIGPARVSQVEDSACGDEVAVELPLRTVQTVECMLTYPDGHAERVSASGAPIMSDQGEVMGTAYTLHDAQHCRQVERYRMELESAGLVQRLAGGIAHDYNNFLTVILGNISLAREKAVGHDELRAALSAIEEASIGARDLTRQLLAISRGAAREPGVADLQAVVAKACRAVGSDRVVRCDVDIPAGLPSVALVPEVLQKAVEEILVRAVGATPAGGTVRVSALQIESGIEMSIADEGAPLSDDELPSIFDPYVAPWDRGHGLGLASSRASVEHYGGWVAAESAQGRGTTFRLGLPVRQGPVRPTAFNHAFAQRILLMDDDPGVLLVAERMLRRLSYEVVTAVDGDDAVAQFIGAEARGTPIDLAILDLTVPGGTGGEIAAQRLHELSPDLPLVVSSGYSSGDVLTNYERYGFSGVILKPYRMEELAKGLSRVVPRPAAAFEQPKLWD